MIFGPDGEQIPGQGQGNWNPLEYLQNISSFLNGNTQALTYLQTNIPKVLTNPSQLPALLSYFVAWQTFRAVNWTLRTLRFLVQTAPLLVPAIMNLAVSYLGGLAGLSGLAGLTPAVASAPLAAPVPIAAKPDLPAVAVFAAPASAPAPLVSPTPHVAPAGSAAPAVATPAPLPGVEGLGCLVGGPGPGFGPTLGAGMRAEEPAQGRAAVAAPASEAARRDGARTARRRRRVIDRGYRYEYLADAGPAVPDRPSEQGAGAMGFAGTVAACAARPTGLAAIGGDGFGGGPALPLLPGTGHVD
ncbi:hypothetical protein AWC13_22530 [Mycobacterium kubicae]|nr:hypothetical protein AWC13_22530 [Mycobacterium kubicae]QNI10288.1 hypothetical protein GAN18_02860 [Mycobacterium kubicae]